MNEQRNKYLTKTIGNQYYGIGVDGEKALSINYLENNISIGIHGLLPSNQQTTGAKYDYKSGNLIYLTGKKCKALSRILSKATDALENGEDIKSKSVSSATNLIEVSDGEKFNLSKGITIAIYNNIDENKISESYSVFQFRNENIIDDYDFKTGSYTTSTLDTDVDYFIDNLKAFARAWCNADAHFVKKELDFNINRIVSRQMQCMEALGIKLDSPKAAKMSSNNNTSNNSGTTTVVGSTEDLLSELNDLD